MRARVVKSTPEERSRWLAEAVQKQLAKDEPPRSAARSPPKLWRIRRKRN